MQQRWRTRGGQRRREAGLCAVGVLHRVDGHHARQDVVIDLRSPAPPFMSIHQHCAALPSEDLLLGSDSRQDRRYLSAPAQASLPRQKRSLHPEQGARGSGRATCRGCRAPCPAPARRRAAASACGSRAAGQSQTNRGPVQARQAFLWSVKAARLGLSSKIY